jgi:hypothetical protein
MTRSIGSLLPDSITELLDGQHVESNMGAAFECLSVTETGWPYVAMISVGELVATGQSSLRLAIWSTSTTTRNLGRDGRCVLSLVDAGIGYQIRCEAFPAGVASQNEGPDLAVFDLSVADVLEDHAPYATLTSGITYQLHQPNAVLERWKRTIEMLRTWDGADRTAP